MRSVTERNPGRSRVLWNGERGYVASLRLRPLWRVDGLHHEYVPMAAYRVAYSRLFGRDKLRQFWPGEHCLT